MAEAVGMENLATRVRTLMLLKRANLTQSQKSEVVRKCEEWKRVENETSLYDKCKIYFETQVKNEETEPSKREEKAKGKVGEMKRMEERQSSVYSREGESGQYHVYGSERHFVSTGDQRRRSKK